VVEYTYDAWGKPLTVTGSMAETLGKLNPLRYRGYVYDTEYGLYYLQSRYYDPNVGRFINADVYAATGQGILGNNMFAYCNNNPVIYCDDAGNLPVAVVNTLAKMVLAGLANGIIGFSIEYFSGSGTFSSSVKEFGKNFWGGFLSGIPKIGDTLSVLYDVNEAIKSCNKAGITGRDRLFAVGSTVLTSLVPSVNSLDLTITSDLALSYLMGDAFIGFAPSLINEAYLNEIYSDQTQYAPQQIRCTTSVMSNVPAGGGMFNGVKTVNCIH
jgi:RHS repeat-associated protein